MDQLLHDLVVLADIAPPGRGLGEAGRAPGEVVADVGRLHHRSRGRPSSRFQTSVRSRPCTITGSPLRTESRTWSASVRQQVTENQDVGPSTQSPSRSGAVGSTRPGSSPPTPRSCRGGRPRCPPSPGTSQVLRSCLSLLASSPVPNAQTAPTSTDRAAVGPTVDNAGSRGCGRNLAPRGSSGSAARARPHARGGLREADVGPQGPQPLHHRRAPLGEVRRGGAAQVPCRKASSTACCWYSRITLSAIGPPWAGEPPARTSRGQPDQPRHLCRVDSPRRAQSPRLRVSICPSRLRAQTAKPTSSRNAGTIANR